MSFSLHLRQKRKSWVAIRIFVFDGCCVKQALSCAPECVKTPRWVSICALLCCLSHIYTITCTQQKHTHVWTRRRPWIQAVISVWSVSGCVTLDGVSVYVTMGSVSQCHIIHLPHCANQCSYRYIMIDSLNWRKPSFSLCEQPHCELKQAGQLEKKKQSLKLVIDTVGPITMRDLVLWYLCTVSI